MTKCFTHLDEQGRASMVDVSSKADSVREATAQARLKMLPETLKMIIGGNHAKGDVLATARIAGIQAAKKTADLIPLCHPLALSHVQVSIEPDGTDQLLIEVCCRLTGKTGVEMEALTGASVAALTVYDMCKAVDRGMQVEKIALLAKSGGQSGDYSRSLS